jgi:hypothetical protein
VYRDANQRKVFLVATQGSIYTGSHELFYCLLATGWKPEILETVDIPTRSGTVHASLIRTHRPKGTGLSLMWYQWPLGTASQIDLAWRLKILENAARGMLPLCREVQIACTAPETENDVKRLSEVAAAVAGQPF